MAESSDVANDIVAGLKALAELPPGEKGNTLAIMRAMLRHIGPHVESVSLSGTRKVSVAKESEDD